VENSNSSREWRVELLDASLTGYELGSRGIQNNDKKEIRLVTEDSMCDLK
jgi:hypothetical protein